MKVEPGQLRRGVRGGPFDNSIMLILESITGSDKYGFEYENFSFLESGKVKQSTSHALAMWTEVIDASC